MRRTVLTDYPFDKEAYGEVITRARGEKSQADFCEDCGLLYAYLNKCTNGKMKDAPTSQAIKKIVVATKTVTHEELFTAAEYDAEKI